MNIVDIITEIVRNAKLKNIDLRFLKTVDPEKMFQLMTNDAEYRALVESFLSAFKTGMEKGLSENHAVGIMLSTHGDMLRYVIMKSVKEELLKLGADDLKVLSLSYNENKLREKMMEASKQLLEIENRARDFSKSLSGEQFKYSLEYAAEKWGNQKEKEAVKSLISKIKIEPIKS